MMEFPTESEEIIQFVKERRAEIQQLEAKIKMQRAMLTAVREICTHPETESGNTWGRDSWTRCKICGKEW